MRRFLFSGPITLAIVPSLENLEVMQCLKEQYKYLLNDTDIPKHWYNINADMPVPSCACPEPADAGTDHAGIPECAVPDVADHAGSQHGPVHRYP